MKNVMLIVVMCSLVVASANAWTTIFSDGLENHTPGTMGQSPPSDIGDGWWDRNPNGSEVVVNTVAHSGNQSLEVTRDNYGTPPPGTKASARSTWTPYQDPDPWAADGIDVRFTHYMNRANPGTGSGTELYYRMGGGNVAGLMVGQDYTTENYSYLDFNGWVADTGIAATVGGWDKVVTTLHLAHIGTTHVGGTFDMDITPSGGVPINVVTGAPMIWAPLAGAGWWEFYINAKPNVNPLYDNVVYYDDLLVEATPEPATMCLLALGGLMLRRKK